MAVCGPCILTTPLFSGPAYAKLVGQESKEMPLVCFHLNKLVGAAAVEAAGNVSQELFKEYKSKHESLVKGFASHLSSL